MLLFTLFPLALVASTRDEHRDARRAFVARLFGGTIPETPLEVTLEVETGGKRFALVVRHPSQTEVFGRLEVRVCRPEEIDGAQCETLAERMDARVGRPLSWWTVQTTILDPALRGLRIGEHLYRAAIAEVGRRGGLLLPGACYEMGSTSGMAEAVWQRLRAHPDGLWIEAGTLRRSRPGTTWPIVAFDPVAAGLVSGPG
jgi:GNAT superfamily N-acetyltransferase